jgi:hypothetical protein
MPSPISRVAAVSLLLLVIPASACRTWRTSDAPPRLLIEEGRPSALRVTQSNGDHVYLRAPAMSGDTVVGERLKRGPAPVPIAIPMDRVSRLATSEFSGARTVLALLVPIGAILAIIGSQMEFGGWGSGSY